MSNRASDSVDWIPPLLSFNEYGGDWNRYLNAIYAAFKHDFVDDKPIFRGRRLGLKRHPLTDGKEATFWHMIQEGSVEAERTPDLRRCERIRWPRAIIEHEEELSVKVWVNYRGKEKRICLWFVPESYLVVLADRDKYILPWTAYPVERPHQQRKLQREYDAYKKNESQKG